MPRKEDEEKEEEAMTSASQRRGKLLPQRDAGCVTEAYQTTKRTTPASRTTGKKKHEEKPLASDN